jgi:hypothetical protein
VKQAVELITNEDQMQLVSELVEKSNKVCISKPIEKQRNTTRHFDSESDQEQEVEP